MLIRVLFFLKEIVSTAQEYSIYESIELGGIDADELQNILQKVIGDFKSVYTIFRGKFYGIMFIKLSFIKRSIG